MMAKAIIADDENEARNVCRKSNVVTSGIGY